MAGAIQLELRPDQEARLQKIATLHGLTVADLIREGVDRLLLAMDSERVPVEDDPMLRIIGMIADGPTDMAARHDDYLAEIAGEEPHR